MQNGTTVGTPYFPPTPLPYHPATFTHMPYTQHAQSFFQSPALNLNQPAFNPTYPIQWQPPQWNIPMPSLKLLLSTTKTCKKTTLQRRTPLADNAFRLSTFA
jgi:hypothetical protein